MQLMLVRVFVKYSHRCALQITKNQNLINNHVKHKSVCHITNTNACNISNHRSHAFRENVSDMLPFGRCW